MSIANPITATIALLRADAGVLAALGGTLVTGTVPRVAGSEVSSDLAKIMPQRALIVAAAGAGSGVGQNDYVPVSVRRLDLRCYGRTPHEADTLALAAQVACKAWVPRLIAGVYVHHYRHVAGPVSFRDPDGDWPVTITTVQIQYADQA